MPVRSSCRLAAYPVLPLSWPAGRSTGVRRLIAADYALTSGWLVAGSSADSPLSYDGTKTQLEVPKSFNHANSQPAWLRGQLRRSSCFQAARRQLGIAVWFVTDVARSRTCDATGFCGGFPSYVCPESYLSTSTSKQSLSASRGQMTMDGGDDIRIPAVVWRLQFTD